MERKYAVIGNVRSEKAMEELQVLFNTLLGSENVNQTVFYKWWYNGRKTVVFMDGKHVVYDNMDDYENMENVTVLKAGNILNNEELKNAILFEANNPDYKPSLIEFIHEKRYQEQLKRLEETY